MELKRVELSFRIEMEETPFSFPNIFYGSNEWFDIYI